jgi:hypothetical protein
MPKSTWGIGPVARPRPIVRVSSATPNAIGDNRFGHCAADRAARRYPADRRSVGAAIFWIAALSLVGWAMILIMVLFLG